MKFAKKINMLAAAGLMLCATSSFAQLYQVDINTSSLGSGYSIDFQFNDGGILGNNSATLSNFLLGGGSAAGSPTTFDGATGSVLSNNVSFNNSGSFQELYEGFTAGSTLSFTVNLTNNSDGLTPDAFVVGILDNTLGNIPTTGFGNQLAQIDLTGAALAPQTFAGTGAFSGVSVTVAPIPEPETYAMLIAGLGLLGFAARRKHKAAQ